MEKVKEGKMYGDGRRQDFGRWALNAIYKCYIIKLFI